MSDTVMPPGLLLLPVCCLIFHGIFRIVSAVVYKYHLHLIDKALKIVFSNSHFIILSLPIHEHGRLHNFKHLSFCLTLKFSL